ncbi:hypothetical protein AbraIFM66951_011412 [Aspergillus brasiliensis]|nr:hypothetical protein AbraIFM66951_011412 [Aspergillus brasiliensis]
MADAEAAVADRWSFPAELFTQSKQGADSALLDDAGEIRKDHQHCKSFELDLGEKTNGKTNKKKNVISRSP